MRVTALATVAVTVLASVSLAVPVSSNELEIRDTSVGASGGLAERATVPPKKASSKKERMKNIVSTAKKGKKVYDKLNKSKKAKSKGASGAAKPHGGAKAEEPEDSGDGEDDVFTWDPSEFETFHRHITGPDGGCGHVEVKHEKRDCCGGTQEAGMVSTAVCKPCGGEDDKAPESSAPVVRRDVTSGFGFDKHARSGAWRVQERDVAGDELEKRFFPPNNERQSISSRDESSAASTSHAGIKKILARDDHEELVKRLVPLLAEDEKQLTKRFIVGLLAPMAIEKGMQLAMSGAKTVKKHWDKTKEEASQAPGDKPAGENPPEGKQAGEKPADGKPAEGKPPGDAPPPAEKEAPPPEKKEAPPKVKRAELETIVARDDEELEKRLAPLMRALVSRDELEAPSSI